VTARVLAGLSVALLVGLGASPAAAQGEKGEKRDESLKEAFAEVGRSIGAVARETGHATRDAVKATGSEVKSAAREADAATQDERDGAAETGKGLWAETRRSVIRALDEFAAALRGLSRDIDGSD